MSENSRETGTAFPLKLLRLLVFTGLALGYFALARLGLLVASVHGSVSPVWPATGLAIGALVLGGCRLWPAIALGAFAANFVTPVSWFVAAGIAAGNTLEALCGACLVVYSGRFLKRFGSFETPLAYVVASVAAPVLSASAGVALLFFSGSVDRLMVATLWRTWWIGDVLGAMIVAPLLPAVRDALRESVTINVRVVARVVGLGVIVAAVCWFVFLGHGRNIYLFAVFPLLILTVFWFGSAGVKLIGFVVAAVGVASTVQGVGPFVTGSLNEDLIHLQLFLMSAGLAALVLPGFKKAGGYGLPLVVMLVGWLLSGWIYLSLSGASHKVDDTRFKALVSDATGRIEKRISDYEAALQAGVALFGASQSVDRDEWASFARDLKLREKFPGIQGLGVVYLVRSGELDAFLLRVRADGAPDFAIWNVPNAVPPSGAVEAGAHYVITYCEPADVNQRVFGLDVASEINRESAARAACDSGKARLTRHIQLVQDQRARPSALFFVPLYKVGFPVDTVEQRRQACLGWVYASLVTESVLENVLGERVGEIHLRCFEGKSTSPKNLLYGSSAAAKRSEAFSLVTQIEVGGQIFTLGWDRAANFIKADSSMSAWAASSAVVVSLLLAALVLSLQAHRRNAEELVHERTAELEKTNKNLQREIFVRQRVEHSMRESHRLQQAILNSANYSIISTTPDGVILTFNAAAERLLGYRADEVVGTMTLELIHDKDEVVARAAALTKELGVAVLPGFGTFVARARVVGVDEQEWTYVRRDRTRFPVHLSVTALRNENQVITGYLGIAQDLTVRKEAEARARQALDELARQKFALDQHAIVAVTDVEGTITYANERFCAISGYSREELVGQNHRLLKSGVHPREFYAQMFDTIDRGEVWQGEICNRAKNGCLYWEAATIVPFHGLDGRLAQFVAIRTDITERKRAAELAAQSERLIRAVTDGLPGLVAYWTADLRCTFANRAYREWFGLPTGPLEGMSITDVIGEKLYRSNKLHIEGALKGETQAFERILHKVNGETGYTWSQYVPDFEVDGTTVRGFFVLISDVTDVKKKAEALRESARRIRLAADAAGLAIWEWDLRTNKLVWDERMYELYGVPPAPNGVVEYSVWASHVLHEDIEAQEAILRETVRKNGHSTREFRIRRTGESKLRYIYACEDVIKDDDGRAIGVVGVNMDITERKEAERSIHESEERTRLFAEHTPASVAMFDLDMRYLVVSRQWVSDNRLEGQSIIGRCHYDVFPKIPARWKAIYQRCLAGAVETSESDRLDWLDGAAQWLRWEVRPWYKDGGGIGGIVMFTQDMTLQKELELNLSKARDDALEASRLKSEFLATMSHEIRTPMNGIIGMAGLLLQSPLESKQHEMARVVVSSAQSLLAIINDILDFSKIEAGKFRVDPVDFNLRDTIEEAVALLAPQAYRKNLELVCDIDPTLPNYVHGDGGRIQQVLINLLGNALKFTEQGEVRVSARVFQASGSRINLRIEVKDTGIGIPESAKVHLFRPFTQADGSTTRRYGGSGLGLAISHQLATLMGGQLGFESTEDIGSCFWFEISLVLAVAPVVEAAEHLPADGRILVVNEHKANRQILLRQIVALEVECDAVADSEQAIERLRVAAEQGARYSVVIIDWDAGERGGQALAQAIRSDPKITNTRLIALSSSPQAITAQLITDLNLAEVLGKPVRDAQLRRCLLRSFGRRETPVPFQQKNTLGGRGLKLLLAEDNPTNQIVAQMMLEQLGHTIDVAANGQEALDQFARNPYDAILMDCQMPVVDGYEATRRIRAGMVPGGNPRIPIIALTAYAMPGDRTKTLAAGMDDYVPKPIDNDALLAAFARCGLLPKSLNGRPKKEIASPVATVAVVVNKTVFDSVRREKLRKIKTSAGISLWEKVVRVFLEEMPGRMDLLARLVGERQDEKLAELAHTMEGSAVSIGAIELQRAALGLETAARDRNWASVSARFLEVEQAWKDSRSELAMPEEKA